MDEHEFQNICIPPNQMVSFTSEYLDNNHD